MCSLIEKHKVESLENALNILLQVVESGCDESKCTTVSDLRDKITEYCCELSLEKQLVFIHEMNKYELIKFDDIFIYTTFHEVALYICKKFSHEMTINATIDILNDNKDELSKNKIKILLNNLNGDVEINEMID